MDHNERQVLFQQFVRELGQRIDWTAAAAQATGAGRYALGPIQQWTPLKNDQGNRPTEMDEIWRGHWRR